jgi:penicillin amidase
LSLNLVAHAKRLLYTEFLPNWAGVNLRIVLRGFFWIFAILMIATGAAAWWFIYRSLPQIDGNASLPGLGQEVSVERDVWGVPHIRAASVEDLAEAQGYVMAQDRLWQMDLLRRAARGQLSEILGSRTLNIDKSFRTYGFARAAERDSALLDPESHKVMDAFARGVNHFIEQHKKNLPLEFSLLRYGPQPWQPSDTLAISAYMYRTLTDTWERELNRAKVAERAGADRAKDLFSEEAARNVPQRTLTTMMTMTCSRTRC